MYKRDFVNVISKRLAEENCLMQFIIGPRQVGKTTGVEMFLDKYKGPYHYVLVEADLVYDSNWLRLQWQKATALGDNSILVIDEIQKIENWSEILKSLWDINKKKQKKLKCLFLGSSSLNLYKGLSESLTGRYEVIPVYHWNFLESQKISKNLKFKDFCIFGGYPKSYDFLDEPKRFKFYLRDSIIRNVIEKDILLNHTVKKPALFKQTAELLSSYPSKYVSYSKLLGQLQEGGNVELIKYYLTLYENAYLFKSVPKFAGPKSRASSPKIISLAPAINEALCPVEIDFGYKFENLVGGELLKHVDELFYWQEGDYEVDYVVRVNKKLFAIEVKSGRKKHSKSMDILRKKNKNLQIIIIDQDEYMRLCKQKEYFFS